MNLFIYPKPNNYRNEGKKFQVMMLVALLYRKIIY